MSLGAEGRTCNNGTRSGGTECAGNISGYHSILVQTRRSRTSAMMEEIGKGVMWCSTRMESNMRHKEHLSMEPQIR